MASRFLNSEIMQRVVPFAKTGRTKRSLDVWGERSLRTFGQVKSESQMEGSMRLSDRHVWKSEESLVSVSIRESPACDAINSGNG